MVLNRLPVNEEAHLGMRVRRVDLVDIAVAGGCNVNGATGPWERPPLHVAVTGCSEWPAAMRVAMVKSLLKSRTIDVNAKDGGKTAVESARHWKRTGWEECARMIAGHGQ